jgi:hypothetical protein
MYENYEAGMLMEYDMDISQTLTGVCTPSVLVAKPTPTLIVAPTRLMIWRKPQLYGLSYVPVQPVTRFRGQDASSYPDTVTKENERHMAHDGPWRKVSMGRRACSCARGLQVASPTIHSDDKGAASVVSSDFSKRTFATDLAIRPRGLSTMSLVLRNSGS